MNNNSYLCRLIHDFPDTWQDILTKKGIRFRSEGRLTIFNYEAVCDFSDPVVQESRGIVIDTQSLEPVCWPFRKFGNWNESYADSIDWHSARVQDKIDGSIIKLWYDRQERRWRFSTNGVISAETANAEATLKHTFMDIIRRADNFGQIPFDKLDCDCTYIFEMVSPENRVVIDYPFYRLFHIGTRNNITGREFISDIGLEKPHEYALHSLEECTAAAESLNTAENVDKEGFVVVDKDFCRIKIKSPRYLVIHHTIGNGAFTKERCLRMLTEGITDIDGFCRDYPRYAVILRFYQYKLAELEYEVGMYTAYVRNLYEELSRERKAVAAAIKTHRLAGFGFKAIDSEKTAGELIADLSVTQLCRYIDEYDRKFDPSVCSAV
ncbi:MAG: hypothetical protein K6G68_08200 [Oscillospiraceae bacterium]|nr:hypothetical protein [Oscillospiraceae bacterium]